MVKQKRARTKKIIDPQLKQMLDKASADATVQATFTLTTPQGDPYREAASTQAAVKAVVGQAAAKAGKSPYRVSVFPNVQSFAISAPAALVREVMKHGDVVSATANVQEEELLIRPVAKPRRKRSTTSSRKRER
jgi:hypothetical protein